MLRSPFVVLLLWFVVGWLGALVAAPAQGWVDRTGPNGPGPMLRHAMCYDPARGHVLMVGARYTNAPQGVEETWSWDGASWVLRASSSSVVPIYSYAMAVDTSTNQVYSARWNGSGAVTISTWSGTAWSSVASVGWGSTSSNCLDVIAMSYDPTRNQIVIFSSGVPSHVIVFNGITWGLRQVTSPTMGSGNCDYIAMAFDPSVNKIVLALGQGSYPGTARFYEWNGFGWNQRLPSILPTWGFAAMATDTLRGRIVAIDRDDYASIPVPHHTWSFVNGVATRLITPAEPTLRQRAAMAFDPVRGVHVMFGGQLTTGFLFADTWEFDLGPLAAFTPYGTGCTGSRGVPQLVAQTNSLPRIGQTFTTRTSNLPWTGPALMLLGVSDTNYSGTPLPVDLSMLNAPGCFLRTSIEDVQPLQNVLGTATWSFVIPPVPGATFYLQTVPFDAVANPLGLTFSNGGRAVVGL